MDIKICLKSTTKVYIVMYEIFTGHSNTNQRKKAKIPHCQNSYKI